jgi:Sulfotransferase domain
VAHTLDFLVIGAQRSGTTSLWRHLASHPEIHVPPSKEAPFFSHGEPFARGFEWYLGEFFADAAPTQQWGTVSPHYMMGSPDTDVHEVARRIHSHLPCVKLIAVLRDPIERAQSHHRMVVHRGRETRDFDTAAREMLVPEELARARREPPLTQPYFVQGEYGRILDAYLALFDRAQLHVLLTDDLREEPGEALRAIFSFLGIDENHDPPALEERHHRGGRGRRLDDAAEQKLKRYLAQEVWPRTPHPAQQRRAFDFWFMQWNVIPEESFAPLDPGTRAQLNDHYARDAELLESLTGLTVPWRRAAQAPSAVPPPPTAA